jgi:Zn-finger nucleic acid-binding protein
VPDAHQTAQEEPVGERICPICSIPMTTVNVGGSEPFLIEKCERCYGLFFDPGELDALLEKEAGDVQEIDYRLLTSLAEHAVRQPVTYRNCPVCGGGMVRRNFGAQSGVITDRCAKHGIFLDAGELRQLVDWRKAGGHRLDAAHREKQAKQEKRQRNEQRFQSSLGVSQSRTQYPAYERNETDVVDVLIGLVGRLFR